MIRLLLWCWFFILSCSWVLFSSFLSFTRRMLLLMVSYSIYSLTLFKKFISAWSGWGWMDLLLMKEVSIFLVLS